jgi:hypothetical protein
MTSSTKSGMRKVIDAWCEGHRNWHSSACAAFRAPNAAHVVVGVNAPKPWTVEETNDFFRQWEGIPKSGVFTIHDYYEDAPGRKAAVWLELNMTFQDELQIEPYRGIYMFCFHFDDNDKITKFVEFVDFANTAGFVERVQNARIKLGRGPLTFPEGKAEV